jgi:hypothetical protein
MKTSVTLNNGTILEVGKKYRQETYLAGFFMEIISIGNEKLFVCDERGIECLVMIDKNWLPYTAPQEELKWKTFLIEFDSELEHQQLYRFKSIDDAVRYSGKDAKITEVDIEIKEK